MKLLLIGNYLSGKAYNQNVWQDLANHLQCSGYGVLTASGKKNRILRLLDMLWTIWHKKNEYDVAQVDVFSGNAFTWAYLSVKLLKRINKRIILTLHGGDLPNFSKHHIKKVRWLLIQSDAVTAPSGYLLESMRLYRDDIVMIPNALDISRYPFVQRRSIQPVMIWLRAFHKNYHPEMAIEVLRHLHRNFPTLRLIMIGPDKGDGSLQRTQDLVENLEMENFVEFPGAVPKDEVPKWLNKGDIFINTTNYDNTPISVMEAMACGLCVVSTNVGGMPYLIDNMVNGILVPPKDSDTMAEVVKQILNEPQLAETLSKNARSKIGKFDWTHVLAQWKELINSIYGQ